jgi:hypothetical protein
MFMYGQQVGERGAQGHHPVLVVGSWLGWWETTLASVPMTDEVTGEESTSEWVVDVTSGSAPGASSATLASASASRWVERARDGQAAGLGVAGIAGLLRNEERHAVIFVRARIEAARAYDAQVVKRAVPARAVSSDPTRRPVWITHLHRKQLSTLVKMRAHGRPRAAAWARRWHGCVCAHARQRAARLARAGAAPARSAPCAPQTVRLS